MRSASLRSARIWGAGIALGIAGALSANAQSVREPQLLPIDEIKIGALYHDMPALWSGFSLERPAADANLEVLFSPWARTFGGTLRPALGTTFNFNHQTSKAYADLRWEIEAPSGVFFGIGMGAAIHEGNLGPIAVDRKALGSRVLFHPSAEIGFRLDGVNSVSIFADHVSNGFTRRYNEGMDTLGVRFGHKLGAAPAVPVAVFDDRDGRANFAGLYLGIAGGYQLASADWSSGSSRDRTSPMATALVGYNAQSGQGVWGIEADTSALRTNLAGPCVAAPNISCRIAANQITSVRTRYGWVFGDTMLYGTGGVAIATWNNSAIDATTGQQSIKSRPLTTGVVVGAGIEQKLSAQLGARVEVLHHGLPGATLTIPGAGTTTTQLQSTVGRLGLSWHFN